MNKLEKSVKRIRLSEADKESLTQRLTEEVPHGSVMSRTVMRIAACAVLAAGVAGIWQITKQMPQQGPPVTMQVPSAQTDAAQQTETDQTDGETSDTAAAVPQETAQEPTSSAENDALSQSQRDLPIATAPQEPTAPAETHEPGQSQIHLPMQYAVGTEYSKHPYGALHIYRDAEDVMVRLEVQLDAEKVAEILDMLPEDGDMRAPEETANADMEDMVILSDAEGQFCAEIFQDAEGCIRAALPDEDGSALRYYEVEPSVFETIIGMTSMPTCGMADDAASTGGDLVTPLS